MNELQSENDLSGWFSTYGLITVQRILERYKIKLQQDDLLFTLKTPDTFYHRLLRVPLRNVFNGIILQQARDYQLYAQKIFIDYLLSGESGKEESAPGGNTRVDLEAERVRLVSMTESFHKLEFNQEKLIAESQKILMKNANNWQKILQKISQNINKSISLIGVNGTQRAVLQALIAL